MIPIASSTSAYSYATLGEIVAWIIGWDLILEYAVSNMAVAVGFSAYVDSLLRGFGIELPRKLMEPMFVEGKYTGAWFNVPGFLIVMILTVLLVVGIRESAGANNLLVGIKIVAILVFIVAASRFIHVSNWHPFMPSGWQGVLTGGAIVFFTYIGFDSVSTAAEECKNPQKDVPFGIIASLIVCATLYITVALVLTGVQNWQTLRNAAPVANALAALGLPTVMKWVTVGALMGMISSLLVFQLGQARVWFAMSRDGLLPEVFSKVHPRSFCIAARQHLDCRSLCGHSRGDLRHRHACRPLQHRDLIRICPGRVGGSRFAANAAGAAPFVSDALGAGRARARHPLVLCADGEFTSRNLDSILCLAGDRSRNLPDLQSPSFRVWPGAAHARRAIVKFPCNDSWKNLR